MLLSNYLQNVLVHISIILLTLYNLKWQTVAAETPDSEKQASSESSQVKPEELYKRLLAQRRIQHLEAVNTIVNIGGYEKQYKMIALLFDKLFTTTKDAKIKLMEAGFTPGDPFPTDESIKDAFSNIIENTVFFADLLLRLPEISHDILGRNKEWDLTAKWGVSFCNESIIFEKRETQLLNLMAQELGIIEKEESYVNPYRKDADMSRMVEDIVDQELMDATRKRVKKGKKKEKRKRGPRLSGVHTEL